MNFLAHCFLSGDEDELMVGNFLADYIGNRPLDQYPAGVQKGVLLHREIDAYTDAHPEVLKGVRRLYPYHHKYSTVIIDILYDYLLVHNWATYSVQPVKEYTQATYKVLLSYIQIMPARLQKNLPLMVADDWLFRYGTMDGLDDTFARLKRRVSKPEHFEGVLESLQRDFRLLNKEFNLFFPDLLDRVRVFLERSDV
jgi:acyl carrier protein phosphodiesterase